MTGRVFVLGAGLAGLAAALTAASRGRPVTLIEAAPIAGGRCRSFTDPRLGLVLDNGNHLFLRGNRAVFDYLHEIGAAATVGPLPDGLPMLDLGSDQRWRLRPTALGLSLPGHGGAIARDAARLMLAGRARTARAVLGETALTRAFWDPLVTAALNAEPEAASALLMGRSLAAPALGGGPRPFTPYIARGSLAASFVDPAVARLRALGAELRFSERVRRLVPRRPAIAAIETSRAEIALGPRDRVVLALPPSEAVRLAGTAPAPEQSNAIVNLHFHTGGRIDTTRLPPVLGLVGGTAQWLFRRDPLVSVTISAADAWLTRPEDDLVALVWRDIAFALTLPGRPACPPVRVVKERRATFRQDPVNRNRRPGPRTGHANLFLAGDWTATGLPATLESAIRSGRRAGRLAAR